MPNKSFNADIRYSEITEISLKQDEMEREKQFISVAILVCFLAYVHDVEAISAFVASHWALTRENLSLQSDQ